MSGQFTFRNQGLNKGYDSVDEGGVAGYMTLDVGATENLRFALSYPAFDPASGLAKVLGAVTWTSTVGNASAIDTARFYDSDDNLCFDTTAVGIVPTGNAIVLPKLIFPTAAEPATVTSGAVG